MYIYITYRVGPRRCSFYLEYILYTALLYYWCIHSVCVCAPVCIIAVFRNDDDDNMGSSVYTMVGGGGRVTRPFLKRRRLTVLDV